MKLLTRISSFIYLRSIARDLNRISESLQRAHPKLDKPDAEQQVVIDEYEDDVKTESDDLDQDV